MALATEPRVLASTIGLTREDWLRIRKQGIGSSDSAAVLGLDRYRSALDVYLDKKGLLPEQEGNRFTEWGTRLEPLVADWFAQETGKKVRQRHAVLQHSQRPYVLANLDRTVVGEPAVLEIKTTSAYNRDEWEDEEIPLRVVTQIQHQLAVTGDAYSYWAVLVGGNDPRWGRLERDDVLIAQMLDRYEAFWTQHVEAGVEPAPSTASDADLMTALHPQEQAGATVLIDTEGRKALEALSVAKAAKRVAEEAEKAAKARVQALLGDAEAGFLPGCADAVVTWRTIPRAGYTVEPTAYRQLTLRERVLHG